MKVIFPIAKTGNMVAYPDDMALFSNVVETADGVSFVADYSGSMPLQVYAGEALAGTEPTHRTDVTEYDLIKLLGDNYTAFVAAAKTDINVEVIDRMVKAAAADKATIDLTDQKSIDSMNYLEATGVLGAGEAAIILQGVPL